MSICYPIVIPAVASGFPDATNTGPAAGTVFTDVSGEVNTTSDGQIIEKLNLDGYILLHHSNVTIQDCIIDMNNPANPFYAISPVVGNLVNITIRRVRVIGNTEVGCFSVEDMDGTEISYCDLSGTENAILIASNDVNIHDNYIHDMASGGAEPHIDGIQGFPGPYDNVTIHHNTIHSTDTSGIITGGSSAPEGINTNLTVTNNRFLHAGTISYGMQIKFTDQITVNNNRISRTGGYPTFPIDFVSVTNYSYSGNVDDDTEATITPSIS